MTKPPISAEPIKWTPELVSRFWEVIWNTKLAQFSFSLQAGRSLIFAIKHLLSINSRILDFGAGDGHLVQLMCEQGYKVAAFEPEEQRALKLKAKLQLLPTFLGVENAEPKHQYDCVILAEVIEHILDEHLDDALNRLAAFVKPGGTVVITTPNNEDLELSQCYCPISNTLFHRWQHVRSFTEDTLASLLAKHGIEKVVSHCVEFGMHLYPSAETMDDNMLHNLPPWMSTIRENIPTRIGGESNILYIGRRV